MSQISKEEFCKIIDRIVNDNETADLMQTVLAKQNIALDFFDTYCLFGRNLDILVKVLETMFDDEDGWISYWLFECCGSVDHFEAYDEDGRQFYIHNSSELYDLVVNRVINYE